MFKRLRLGMIGGGFDSMIGNVHRHAACLDHKYQLVGGVFSRSHEKSTILAHQLGLDIKRIYSCYEEMLSRESKLPSDERFNVITIVTPNDLHFELAKAALLAGFHVIIDKPLTQFLCQANELMTISKKVKRLVCVTYVYSGYPMIKEARSLIQSNRLGKIRKVMITFSQGWLTSLIEEQQQKQASWRMDPHRSHSGTTADIGTHAFHLAEYVTGLKTTHIRADIQTAVPKRLLEDDSAILLKFDQGAHGLLVASQIAAGDEVNINLCVYGEKGSIHWQHQDANSLLVKWLDQPAQLLRAGTDNHYLDDMTLYNCRLPAGHSEGFIEAFANLYRNFALCVDAMKHDLPIQQKWNDYPKIEDGIRGVRFVERVLACNQSKEKWLPF